MIWISIWFTNNAICILETHIALHTEQHMLLILSDWNAIARLDLLDESSCVSKLCKCILSRNYMGNFFTYIMQPHSSLQKNIAIDHMVSPHGVSPGHQSTPKHLLHQCVCNAATWPFLWWSNFLHIIKNWSVCSTKTTGNFTSVLRIVFCFGARCFGNFATKCCLSPSQNYFVLAFLPFRGSIATPNPTRASSQASIKERSTWKTEIWNCNQVDFQETRWVESRTKKQTCLVSIHSCLKLSTCCLHEKELLK